MGSRNRITPQELNAILEASGEAPFRPVARDASGMGERDAIRSQAADRRSDVRGDKATQLFMWLQRKFPNLGHAPSDLNILRKTADALSQTNDQAAKRATLQQLTRLNKQAGAGFYED